MQRFLRFQRFLSDQYLPGTLALILGVLFLPFSWKEKEKFKHKEKGKENGKKVSAWVK